MKKLHCCEPPKFPRRRGDSNFKSRFTASIATILNRPPQCGQWVKSRLNTRFSSVAQPKRIGRPCLGGSWLSAAVEHIALTLSCACGTTSQRHFAFGAVPIVSNSPHSCVCLAVGVVCVIPPLHVRYRPHADVQYCRQHSLYAKRTLGLYSIWLRIQSERVLH
jgi:hypothetical protein